eukprot:gene1567-32949_t
MTSASGELLSPSTSLEARANPKSMAGSSRQNDQYLSDLLSYSLDRLRKEPELLESEKKQIERKIQSTSVSNYSAFISTAKCLQTIDTELGAGIPELATACESFSTNSTELMDTCVRNGVYDEALDLQAFISRLGLLHPDVPLVKTLMLQVSTSSLGVHAANPDVPLVKTLMLQVSIHHYSGPLHPDLPRVKDLILQVEGILTRPGLLAPGRATGETLMIAGEAFITSWACCTPNVPLVNTLHVAGEHSSLGWACCTQTCHW